MSKGPVGIYGLIIPFLSLTGLVFGTENIRKILENNFYDFNWYYFRKYLGITVYTKYPEDFYLL